MHSTWYKEITNDAGYDYHRTILFGKVSPHHLEHCQNVLALFPLSSESDLCFFLKSVISGGGKYSG